MEVKLFGQSADSRWVCSSFNPCQEGTNFIVTSPMKVGPHQGPGKTMTHNGKRFDSMSRFCNDKENFYLVKGCYFICGFLFVMFLKVYES
jgi:hypothetical protein